MKVYSSDDVTIAATTKFKCIEESCDGALDDDKKLFHILDCDDHNHNDDENISKVYCNKCLDKNKISRDNKKVYEIRNAIGNMVKESLGRNPRMAWCNICSTRCYGVNWKCVMCFGYDLCYGCEKSGYHDRSHAMLKIYWSVVDVSFPRAVFPSVVEEKKRRDEDLEKNPEKIDWWETIYYDPIHIYPKLYNLSNSEPREPWRIKRTILTDIVD